MPKDAIELANDFSAHVRYLDTTRRKLERLFAMGVVVKRDIDQVYSGIYMECLTSFERLIEDLFIGLLSNRLVTSQTDTVPLVEFRNKQAIRPMVYAGRNYVDWIPYHQTEERAKIFFRNGQPFTNLNAHDKNVIGQCTYVRNAIAHKSLRAKKVFDEQVLSRLPPLMAREKTPTGHLRSVFRNNPMQTRYENYVFEMTALARKLCS